MSADDDAGGGARSGKWSPGKWSLPLGGGALDAQRLCLLLGALALCAGFSGLGWWQLSRAEEKTLLHQKFRDRALLPPIDLNGDLAQRRDIVAMHWRRALAAGEYASSAALPPAPAKNSSLPEERARIPGSTAELLLDNQVHDRQVGYLVYTAFRFRDEPLWVLVNRGWVAAAPYRESLPFFPEPPSGQVRLQGLAEPLPGAGLRLSGERWESVSPAGRYRVPFVDLREAGRIFGMELLPYAIRLEEGAAGGLLYRGTVPGSGRERHLGYAFQWFCLAALMLCLFGFGLWRFARPGEASAE